ncbi:MAG: efflux RND transporter periplasmic adaptor subunit [Acidobacteria bacterium]|nr:efflux RND transporter periplasmic adaptor subunit [Acidobacteriota bacterium]
MGADLSRLKIDRGRRQRNERPLWARWWAPAGLVLLLALGLWSFFGAAGEPVVAIQRVEAARIGGDQNEPGAAVVLQAAGYVVPHHKIEVASKVSGRVAWIGVEKGDHVEKGQVLVRLEDNEFRARVKQSEGETAALRASLEELETGSRPEEVQRASADLEEGKADLEKARLDLERAKKLVSEQVWARQELDNAQAAFDARQARVEALGRSLELLRIGPRKEVIEAMRGQLQRAQGQLDFDRTQLDATIIRAPVTGTILERNVETGEFVTTSFVGERGAKGYVVSLADLNDLQVELDISQDDFAKLSMGQKAIATTDAYRDREYKGEIVEISPEADRQKATVQVKVQILEPDSFLRPEMNANVAFLAPPQAAASGGGPAPAPAIRAPSSAVRNGKVFLYVSGKVIERAVETRPGRSGDVEVVSGLSGGEDLVVNPPEGLTDGQKVRLEGEE